MVKYIIVALIAFTLVALAVIWVLSGGPRKVFENTQALADRATLEEGEVAFQLPWQPAQIFPTLDITDALDLSDGSETGKTEARLVEFEAEYDRLSAEVQTTRSFGNPSPYIGKISIVQDVAGVRANTAGEEYLQIAANYSNPEAIDISAGHELWRAVAGKLSLSRIPGIQGSKAAPRARILRAIARRRLVRENMYRYLLFQRQPPLEIVPLRVFPYRIKPLLRRNVLRENRERARMPLSAKPCKCLQRMPRLPHRKTFLQWVCKR